MPKRFFGIILALLSMLLLSLPVAASPVEADVEKYAFLPSVLVNENLTEYEIHEKLDTLSEENVTHIVCNIGLCTNTTHTRAHGTVSCNVSMKNLAKWIKLAHENNLKILIGIQLDYVPHGNGTSCRNDCSRQISEKIGIVTDKVLVDGISYFGADYFADGIHFEIGANTDKVYELLDMLANDFCEQSLDEKMLTVLFWDASAEQKTGLSNYDAVFCLYGGANEADCDCKLADDGSTSCWVPLIENVGEPQIEYIHIPISIENE